MSLAHNMQAATAVSPITALNTEGADGAGVGVGLGAADHGSKPSYADPPNGPSST